MIYSVLRLCRLDNAVQEMTLGLRLSTKQSKAIEEIWTFLSAVEAATDSTTPVIALDCHSTLDDDQGQNEADNPLQWWRLNQSSYPVLSHLALQLVLQLQRVRLSYSRGSVLHCPDFQADL